MNLQSQTGRYLEPHPKEAGHLPTGRLLSSQTRNFHILTLLKGESDETSVLVLNEFDSVIGNKGYVEP